jgi:hypothetical protein
MRAKIFPVSVNRSGGLGLWFPEIINRVSSTDLSNNNTICEMLDASIDDNIANVVWVWKCISFDSKVDKFFIFQECNDEVDSKVFVNSLILGGLYTIAYVFISLLIKPVGRGWVLSKYIFIISTTFSVLMMQFLFLSSILPIHVWYVWTSIAMGV